MWKKVSMKVGVYLLLLFMAVISVPSLCARAKEQPPRIKKVQSSDASSMLIYAKLPDIYGEYKIYRASKSPASGGKFSLLDTFSRYGNGWGSTGGYWQTSGDKRKVTCFSENAQMSGEVIFLDTGLKLGRKYYYKIVAESSIDGKTESNIASAKTTLSTPQILKGYAKTNRSVKLSWQSVPKAQQYIIYRKSGKKWVRVKTVKKSTSYTDKNLKAGKTYYYKVRAYAKSGSLKNYSAYSSVLKVSTKSPTVKGTYKPGSVYGPSLNSSKLLEVRRVVQSFKDNYIKKGMSDYDKVLAAFNYIRSNCSYAWRGWQYNNANTAWGALVYGEAQCSGYARGMKALCDGIGVPCYYVHANSKAYNPSHQWNLVKVGGKWYILDAQGGVFLVSGKTYQKMFGMYWNTKGLPSVSSKDHPKGGFAGSIY